MFRGIPKKKFDRPYWSAFTITATQDIIVPEGVYQALFHLVGGGGGGGAGGEAYDNGSGIAHTVQSNNGSDGGTSSVYINGALQNIAPGGRGGAGGAVTAVKHTNNFGNQSVIAVSNSFRNGNSNLQSGPIVTYGGGGRGGDASTNILPTIYNGAIPLFTDVYSGFMSEGRDGKDGGQISFIYNVKPKDKLSIFVGAGGAGGATQVFGGSNPGQAGVQGACLLSFLHLPDGNNNYSLLSGRVGIQ